jgi:hypothetical protein
MTPAGGCSARIVRRIERDFPASQRAQVERTLGALLPESDHAGRERIQAAVLINAAGDPDRLEREAREVAIDWRDVLMAADLGFDDWPARVDAFLGEG